MLHTHPPHALTSSPLHGDVHPQVGPHHEQQPDQVVALGHRVLHPRLGRTNCIRSCLVEQVSVTEELQTKKVLGGAGVGELKERGGGVGYLYVTYYYK